MDSMYKKKAGRKAKAAAGAAQTNAMAAARAQRDRAMAKPKPFKATGDSALKAIRDARSGVTKAPGTPQGYVYKKTPKPTPKRPKTPKSKSIFDS